MTRIEAATSERIGRIAIKWVAAGRLHGFLEEFPELMQVLARRGWSLAPETPVGNIRDLCRTIDTQEME